jgi:Na+/melibiose symporter-like transporter
LGLAVAGIVAIGLIVWRTHGASQSLIGWSLFRIATYRLGVGGGALHFAAAATTMFVLPMLFQIGFGLSAFQSGMLTFALAAGALAMKVVTPPILRQWGFRTVLVGNGLLLAVMLGVTLMFTPATPWLAIVGVLVILGLARSLQFAALNSICYADVSDRLASSATSLSDAIKPLANGMGVALGATVMHILVSTGDGVLDAQDVQPALGVAVVMALASAGVFTRLPGLNSAAIGRRRRRRRQDLMATNQA